MIEINGVKIDFDITRPKDIEVLQGQKAGTKAQQKALGTYKDWLNDNLKEYGNQIDTLFGDGTAQKLLGDNPTLNDIASINDQITAQVEKQADDFTKKFGNIQPNREQ